MPAPYVRTDINHISFHVFAKFSEPDFLALCLCDSSSFFWTLRSAFLSACSSLRASCSNKCGYSQQPKRSLTKVLHFSSSSHLCCHSVVSSQYFSPVFLLSGVCASSYPFSFPLIPLLVLLPFFAAAFLIEGQNKWEKCQVPLSKPADWTCWRIGGLQGIGFIGLLAWVEPSGSSPRISEHNFLLHSSTTALPLSKYTVKGFCISVWGVWVRPDLGDRRSRLQYLSEVISCP